jgi:hypothetical protein
MSNGAPAAKEIGAAANLPLAFKAVDDWRQARLSAPEPQEKVFLGHTAFPNRRRFRRRRKPLPA